MLRNLLGRGPEKSAELPDVRSLYDPTYFDGRKLIANPENEYGVLLNLGLQSEVARLDTNERLDTLIEIQRELLATQKAILEALQRPERS
ncbi:hypothetical protein EXN61_26855 [Agrobacterium tumefaciens]|uniref:Uncharacterized protein n=1 Tax=Agrobacterium tumefaciens TaxID=358 RepID=A0A546XDU1_AGRTU|nr:MULTISPECIES: hypothetical protein [Agrobacterium]MDA5250265.1 hypothetical protein [Agrobacterium sp. MAFF210268]TRA98900.1 hypothetical protein EXN61_26855 [Agrobacterium tumefaciens]